jgi:hypothetical protein
VKKGASLAAERGARPTSEYGGQVSGVGARSHVTDSVDATVHAVERAIPYSPAHHRPTDPGVNQLGTSDVPVLARGDASNLEIY